MKKLLLISSLLVLGTAAIGQVKIGTNPKTLATNANLQVEGTAGEQQFTVLKNGNVGIGTIAPAFALDIINPTVSSNSPFIRIANSGGGAGNKVGINLVPLSTRPGGPSNQIISTDDGNSSAHLSFWTAAAGTTTTSSERMTILNDGNVGIGISGPAVKLDVNGVVRISNSGTANQQGTQLTWNDPNLGTQGFGMSGFLNHRGLGGGGFVFSTTNDNTTFNEFMRINGNGNVGIGTNAPTSKLEVVNNATFNPGLNDLGAIKVSGSYGGGIVFAEGANRAAISAPYGSRLTFSTGGTVNGGAEKMTIVENGNVGIGTDNPLAQLQVAGSGLFGGGEMVNVQGSQILWNNNTLAGTPTQGMMHFLNHRAGAVGGFTFSTTNNGTTFNEFMRIRSDGNVGIGTNNPVEKLHVDGNARIEGIVRLTNGGTFPDAQGTQFAYNNTQLDGEARGKSTFLNHRGDINAFNYGGFIFATASSGVAAKKVLEIDRDGNITQSATGYFKVATGTTDERPPAAFRSAGMIRFNTTLNKFEGFDGTAWQLLN